MNCCSLQTRELEGAWGDIDSSTLILRTGTELWGRETDFVGVQAARQAGLGRGRRSQATFPEWALLVLRKENERGSNAKGRGWREGEMGGNQPGREGGRHQLSSHSCALCLLGGNLLEKHVIVTGQAVIKGTLDSWILLLEWGLNSN